MEADDQFDKEQEAIDVISMLKSMQERSIQLEVRGYKFKTTRETISRLPPKHSKLIEIKTTGNTPTYFIDRDLQYFGFILNYLRNNGERDRQKHSAIAG
jgi:hypothetical protein